jgi:hypothetical protein
VLVARGGVSLADMTVSGRQQVVDRAAAAVLHGHLGRGTPTLGTTRPEVIDGWAEIFRAMADSNRLRILLAAHHSPGINVTGLADAVGMTANATSHAWRRCGSGG